VLDWDLFDAFYIGVLYTKVYTAEDMRQADSRVWNRRGLPRVEEMVRARSFCIFFGVGHFFKLKAEYTCLRVMPSSKHFKFLMTASVPVLCKTLINRSSASRMCQ
jgi:hypothetical protein